MILGGVKRPHMFEILADLPHSPFSIPVTETETVRSFFARILLNCLMFGKL